ncbi:MAG: hypothetical protein SWO11_13540 [Thermodesulfobacteriota bacterium]|nr:hypothetical protein [Thermodesulfobacteriota bacterium]
MDEVLNPPKGSGTDEEVRRLLQSGYKIQAIELYEEIYKVGLKEGKEAVWA